VRFGVDRGYRGGTGNIEQREEHHAVGIELSKAALAHHRGQSRQGCRRIDVDAIEEDGETGYDDFLGRNAGDEGQTDLPVPQADGRKERHDGLADDGPKTVGHIAIAGRAEVEDEPHEDGSGKDVEIHEGEFVGIIGHTGSGKSTLVQILNGLIKPTSGTVTVDGTDIGKKTKEAMAVRHKVGMVFQYPEYQLFEETIAKDIAFGPRNFGLSEEEITERVKEAMDFVGLDYKTYADRSPFRLSGGQMRRVAIAGVIAIHPSYLILDEPSAGLDPIGRREIFSEIQRWHQEKGITVILVSHNMDDISRLASRLLVLSHGHIVLDGEPLDIFATQQQALHDAGVSVPPVTGVLQYLQGRGFAVDDRVRTVEEGAQAIFDCLKGGKGHAH
jgi:energy-coupling factor transport system ATP-binding protein